MQLCLPPHQLSALHLVLQGHGGEGESFEGRQGKQAYEELGLDGVIEGRVGFREEVVPRDLLVLEDHFRSVKQVALGLVRGNVDDLIDR